VVLLVYAILIGFALGIILSIAQLGTQVPLYAAKADGLVTSLTAELAKFGVGPEQLRQAAGSLDLGKLTGLISGLLASVAGLASNLVFLLSLLLFLSIESGASGVGFIIGVVPPAILALLAGGPQLMVIVLIVYCAINFVVQSIIQPRFIGDAVGLSVTVTFLALVFWAWLIGPLGAILAIPLTLLAKAVLVDVDPHTGWADALLRASATKPEPPAAEQAQGDTELAATSVPSPRVEEPGPPSREPTTRMSHEF